MNETEKVWLLVPHKSLTPSVLLRDFVATSIFLQFMWTLHHMKDFSALIADVSCARWGVLQMGTRGMRSCIDGRDGRWRWPTSATGGSTSLLLWEWGTQLTWHTLSQVREDTNFYLFSDIERFALLLIWTTFRGVCHHDDIFRSESENGLLHHPDLHPLQHDRGPVLGLVLDQQGRRPSPNISRWVISLFYA